MFELVVIFEDSQLGGRRRHHWPPRRRCVYESTKVGKVKILFINLTIYYGVRWVEWREFEFLNFQLCIFGWWDEAGGDTFHLSKFFLLYFWKEKEKFPRLSR